MAKKRRSRQEIAEAIAAGESFRSKARTAARAIPILPPPPPTPEELAEIEAWKHAPKPKQKVLNAERITPEEAEALMAARILPKLPPVGTSRRLRLAKALKALSTGFAELAQVFADEEAAAKGAQK